MSLSDDEWRPRHRVLVAVAALHAPALLLIGLVNGKGLSHLIVEVAPLVGLSAIAAWWRLTRRWRTLASTLALVSSSAVLIHVTDGLIESHFHFFVVVALVMLYHDWVVFVAAFLYVVLHHAVIGVFAPTLVYNHQAAYDRPLLWALVHGGFVAAASVAGLVNWHFNARERARADDAAARLERTVTRLGQINGELEVALDARDEFVSRVSQELRTPLTSMRGFAETLRAHADSLPADVRDAGVESIVRNSVRLEHLIDGLLDAGRLAAGVPTVDPEAVTVGAVVERARDAMPEAIDINVVGGITQVLVDPMHLEQVFINLFTNAQRYGQPPVTVTAVARQRARAVEIEVRDSGAGVDEGFVPKLFDRFAQASVGNKRTARGVGLGLWIAKTLIESNGGEITYRSVPDAGACFVIRLPGSSPRP